MVGSIATPTTYCCLGFRVVTAVSGVGFTLHPKPETLNPPGFRVVTDTVRGDPRPRDHLELCLASDLKVYGLGFRGWGF